MPKSSGKREADDCAADETPSSKPEPPSRSGKPKRESVLSETPFKSPKGRTYRIIRTDERDPYDKPVKPEEERDSDQ